MFIAASLGIAKRGNPSKCPQMDEWKNKMWYIYNRILLGSKKEYSIDTWYNLDES